MEESLTIRAVVYGTYKGWMLGSQSVGNFAAIGRVLTGLMQDV